jgi:protein SCO1/2
MRIQKLPPDGTQITRNIAALFVVWLITALGFAACAKRHNSHEQRYELKGKVVNVDKRGAAVTIAHDAIPNYMEAMTMPFAIKDQWAFDVMKAGNRVQATLVVDGERSWLENLVIIEEATDSTGGATSGAGPTPGERVADFALVNQDGKPVTLKDYRGHALVLTFIYTRCPLPDYCPLMTNNFAEIIKALKGDPPLYARTRLLSVSIDPEYDTPKVLRDYGAAYTGETGRQTFSHWEFVAGKRDEVKKIATYFGMQYWPDSGQITHSLRTAVISPEGKLVKLYTGNQWKPADIVADLQAFKPDAQPTADAQPKPDAQANAQAPTQEDPAARLYRGVGVIDSINEERTRMQIDHEDIKDLMPAMNMPFEVKDKALLDGFAAGDRIEFALQALPHGLTVVEIKKR